MHSQNSFGCIQQNQQAHRVISKLMQQSVVFGNPKRVILDRGTAFTSKDFDNYCKDQEIEHIAIVTGVPRGNGQVEHIN